MSSASNEESGHHQLQIGSFNNDNDVLPRRENDTLRRENALLTNENDRLTIMKKTLKERA